MKAFVLTSGEWCTCVTRAKICSMVYRDMSFIETLID